MWRSVYLPRSAVMPITSERVRANSTSACPKGAGFVFCPSAAIDAIMAEVVRRGLPEGDFFTVFMLTSPHRVLCERAAILAARVGGSDFFLAAPQTVTR